MGRDFEKVLNWEGVVEISKYLEGYLNWGMENYWGNGRLVIRFLIWSKIRYCRWNVCVYVEFSPEGIFSAPKNIILFLVWDIFSKCKDLFIKNTTGNTPKIIWIPCTLLGYAAVVCHVLSFFSVRYREVYPKWQLRMMSGFCYHSIITISWFFALR